MQLCPVELLGLSTKAEVQALLGEVEVVDTTEEEAVGIVMHIFLVEEEARATLAAASQQAPPPTLSPAPLASLL